MPTSRPSVCVLIPVWKDQAGLIRTLNTISQDPFPFDIVVVDDGSPEPITCDTRYNSHEVTLERLPENRGIENALNAGLKIILDRGYRYISRLDADDVPMPGRLERQAAYLDEHPKVGIVGTWARCIDDDDAYLFTLRFPAEHAEILRMQRYVPGLLHPTIMIRAEALKTVGLYSDKFRTAEDYDLFMRMARHYELANIPETLTEYKVSRYGTTVSKRRQNLKSRLGIQRAYFSWTDPHAYLGVARTLIYTAIPYSWMIAVKQKLWK